MSSDAVHFLAGRYTLLECAEDVQASLTRVWQEVFGSLPAYDEPGDCVRGIHLPGRTERERAILVMRPCDSKALWRASWLIREKWQLAGVRVIPRPRRAVYAHGWAPDLEERVYDETAVEIWPSEPEHPAQDSIVLELAERPGYFIHRVRQDRRALWTVPADRVADALSLPFPEAAEAWIRSSGGEDGPLVQRWRSAVLAQEDQTAAERREAT